MCSPAIWLNEFHFIVFFDNWSFKCGEESILPITENNSNNNYDFLNVHLIPDVVPCASCTHDLVSFCMINGSF